MSSKSLISFDEISENHPFFFENNDPVDWADHFSNLKPLKLEIGFGNGNFLLDMAIREPDSNFVGIEFYHKGIRKLISRIDQLHIKNIRIVYGDAKKKIPFIFENNSLDEIFINFPDPWPKKRHSKRRLIKPAFLIEVVKKLTQTGKLRIATDYEPYAMEILEYLSENDSLQSLHETQGFSLSRDEIPKTKYEKNFINAGKSIYYFDFVRN